MHTHGVLPLVAGIFCLGIAPQLQAASTQTLARCGAPEITTHGRIHDDLACRGISLSRAGQHKEAAKVFSEALDLNLAEYPNFELFPRLALALHEARDMHGAEVALAKAYVSLSLLIGEIECREEEQGFNLVKAGEILRSRLAEEMAQRMCGGAYDYVYTAPSSFESVSYEGRLIDMYFEARDRIVHDGKVP